MLDFILKIIGYPLALLKEVIIGCIVNFIYDVKGKELLSGAYKKLKYYLGVEMNKFSAWLASQRSKKNSLNRVTIIVFLDEIPVYIIIIVDS